MRACLEREIFMKRREEKKRIEKKKRRREADLARGTPPAIRRAAVAPSGETFRPRRDDRPTDRPGELGPWAREKKFGNEIMTSRSDILLK